MKDMTEEADIQEDRLFANFNKLPELQLAQLSFLSKSDFNDAEAGSNPSMTAVFKIVWIPLPFDGFYLETLFPSWTNIRSKHTFSTPSCICLSLQLLKLLDHMLGISP
jgi:hypothetical protein